MSRVPHLILAFVLATVLSNAQSVVVNEIYTGDPDMVEITNLGANGVDLSGWKLGASFSNLVYPDYTFPVGTQLLPGASLVLIEGTAGLPLSSPTPPTGTTILNSGINYGWVGTSSGSVVLTDAAGACRDFVIFGTGAVAIPTAAIAENYTNPIDRSANNASLHDAMYRSSAIDTNDGQDWAQGIDGQETPGTLNPGQVLGPVVVKGLTFDPAFPSSLVLDMQTQTFSGVAIVKTVILDGGAVVSDPNVEALIGGYVAFNGTFNGGDPVTLAGIVFSPASISLTTPTGSASLSVSTLFQTTTYVDWNLGGGFGVAPIATRELRSVGFGTASTFGSGSQALVNLSNTLATTSFSMIVGVDAGSVRLDRLDLGFQAAPSTAFDAAIATNGLGAVEVGAVNALGGRIYNLFAVNPTTQLGAGPIAGIEAQPLAFAIIAAPVGVHPFHVLADVNGNYVYRTPNGILSPGVVLQHVAARIVGNDVALSTPTEIHF